MLDTKLEYRILVGNMDDLTVVAKDEVPENLVISQVISEDITDEIAEDDGFTTT